MKCPKDKTEMEEKDVEGVIVDVCPSCGGIWLDWGELGRIAGINASEHETVYRGQSSDPCPRCGKRMNLAELHATTIEECKCGLFIDAGEAEKVIGRDIFPPHSNAPKYKVTREQLNTLLEKGTVNIGQAELELKK